MSIFNALKGSTGEFEVQRTLGAVGTLIYSIIAPVFVAVGVIKNVSMTEFCLAYPSGLSACVLATAGAVGWKDRQVATAKVIADTGAVPVAPPAGPQVPVDSPGDNK